MKATGIVRRIDDLGRVVIPMPLLNAHPWFAAGNYGVDCEFKEEGEIDLLVYYCPNRYE